MYFYISVSSLEQLSNLLWIFWQNLCWFQDTIFVFLRYADCATTSHFQYQIVFIRAAKYWLLFAHGKYRWLPLRYSCCIIKVADNTFLLFRLFSFFACSCKQEHVTNNYPRGSTMPTMFRDKMSDYRDEIDEELYLEKRLETHDNRMKRIYDKELG